MTDKITSTQLEDNLFKVEITHENGEVIEFNVLASEVINNDQR